jgi:hypothetical protein
MTSGVLGLSLSEPAGELADDPGQPLVQTPHDHALDVPRDAPVISVRDAPGDMDNVLAEKVLIVIL